MPNTDTMSLSKCFVEGITAESLNDHYSQISTDSNYIPPALKQSVPIPNDSVTEWRVFKVLDTLRSTASGLDGLLTWLLRVGAPIFCSPVTHLFNLSLSTSTVPHQWKQAWIRPVPKVTAPTQHSYFWPISITPVLTRILERMVVNDFIYPAIEKPITSLVFHDQFAFRPTGSTTAAIIILLHKVTHLLLTNPYVIVIGIDFSKAFDTVRHHTLLGKIAKLDLPHNVHNWLVNFFNNHSHQTKFGNKMSTTKSISASIIQRSAIGLASYIVNGSDLQAVFEGNFLLKYADDTYLIIPAVNGDSRSTELSHITNWAKHNNLKLNLAKSQEIIFVDRKRKEKVSEPIEISQLQ